MAPGEARIVAGRYVLHGALASGGMATVHLGRQLGEAGFTRPVAIKRLHAFAARDPAFVDMFLDEARLTSRIRHPNVVPTLDMVSQDGELFVVMEYIEGETLAGLQRFARRRELAVPVEIAASVVCGALHGLHAAHEAKGAQGEPLGVIHRDVSPQNIMVGTDGVGRVLDFGVAKAAGRLASTRDGSLKGKLAYMAPEQLRGKPLDRRADIYAAGVVLWELICRRRLFASEEGEGALIAQVLEAQIAPPSSIVPNVPPALEAVVMCALAADVAHRFPTARDMAIALEGALPLASQRAVGDFVATIAAESLAKREAAVHALERGETIDVVSPHSLGSGSGSGASGGSSRASLAELSDPRSASVGGSVTPAAIERPVANRTLVRNVAVVGAIIALTTVIAVSVTLRATRDPDATAKLPPTVAATTASAATAEIPPPAPPSPTATAPDSANPPPTVASAAPSASATSTTKKAKGKGPDCATSPYVKDAAGILRIHPACR